MKNLKVNLEKYSRRQAQTMASLLERIPQSPMNPRRNRPTKRAISIVEGVRGARRTCNRSRKP